MQGRRRVEETSWMVQQGLDLLALYHDKLVVRRAVSVGLLFMGRGF